MRLVSGLSVTPSDIVSIHASVKDATYGTTEDDLIGQVSIHASVKDATYHRVSCRRKACVSIHASVKDATRPWILTVFIFAFQSTHL